MPLKVRSTNVSKLCAELGFSGAYPGRTEKILKNYTVDFPLESLSLGNPHPFFRGDSPEAQTLALRFCEDYNRGPTLWPDNTHGAWPTWSSDRTKILKLVAHILSLQAFYKYQKLCKDRKKQMALPSSSIPTASQVARELSPESRMLTAPPPPKGTRRRPAKNPGNKFSGPISNTAHPGAAVESASFVADPHDIAQYIEHIESLNPADDEEPLYEFTKKWAARQNPLWPASADRRLLLFMHENHFYNPRMEDRKDIALVNKLRHGTEIESGQWNEYNILKKTAIARVRELADCLEVKKIIAQKNQNFEMVGDFKDFWLNRQDYWNTKPKGTANSTDLSIYDMTDLYDDSEDDCVPTHVKKAAPAKSISGAKSKKASSDPKIPTLSTQAILRRKADDSMSFDRDHSNSANKRQKVEAKKGLVAETDVRPSMETKNNQRIAPETDTWEAEAEATEGLRFAEDFLRLRSPVMTQPVLERPSSPGPSSPRSTTPRRSSVAQNRLVTPTSPEGSFGTIAHIEQSSTPPAQTIMSPPTPNSIATDHISSPRISSIASHHPRTYANTNREIFLTFQNRNGTWDLSNKIPVSQLRSSTLSAFFSFFSQHSNIPITSLDALTFSLLFGKEKRQVEVVLREGVEEQWVELKDKIRKLFKFARDRNPRSRDFDVWVEIGDKREMVGEEEEEEEDDDDDDSRGFYI